MSSRRKKRPPDPNNRQHGIKPPGHPGDDFGHPAQNVEPSRGGNAFPEGNDVKLQPTTLSQFNIIYLIFYLFSLLFTRKKDRPPLRDIHVFISNVMQSAQGEGFSRSTPTPFQELRLRKPGDDPDPEAMPRPNPVSGILANSQYTVISGGTFSVVQQTIESDPSLRKSANHIVYLLSYLSIQATVLF